MSSQAPPTAGKKRKAGDEGKTSSAIRKRQKTHAIRSIPTQPRDAALSATGELDVASFIKARQFEIAAMEKSMQSAKHGLATRAFQQVPRHMRRRTASHNVKQVPRRLRRRAEREMLDDNTPTVTPRRRVPSAKMRLRLETAKRIKSTSIKHITARARKKATKEDKEEPSAEAIAAPIERPTIQRNQLAKPSKATSKFRKRQINKTWLPTHLWHAKRAHMTKPALPLWRMAIPISPTEKSYRSSHRASGGRGAIAWDMSYMSTISCRGEEQTLLSTLGAIGFRNLQPKSIQRKWLDGTRSADGWTHHSDRGNAVIGPICVIWQASMIENTAQDPDVEMKDGGMSSGRRKAVERQLFIRVHPSAFLTLWKELLHVAKGQGSRVAIEDLRFELASIEMIGPQSTEALTTILQPLESDVNNSCSVQTWKKSAGLTNPASLPANALLAFDVQDPRLLSSQRKSKAEQSEQTEDEMIDLMVDWPVDQSCLQANIFSPKARLSAAKSLPSQKAINRRKGESEPEKAPESKTTDPAIPVLLLASRPPANAGHAQGKWTLILPWKCLDAFWRCLMYCRLSSGGTPRFGGLDQTRQVAGERSEPWFPGDFPGTNAGKAWESSEAEERHKSWERKPPGRRVTFDSLKLGQTKGEHGQGWACDWEFLFSLGETGEQSEKDMGKDSAAASRAPGALKGLHEPNTQPLQTLADGKPQIKDQDQDLFSTQLSPSTASAILNASLPTPPRPLLPTSPTIATIQLTFLTRGSPRPCARIYRLPPSTHPLHQSWLSLISASPITPLSQRPARLNWRSDPRTPSAYTESADNAALEAIAYLPPDMGDEALKELEQRREKRRGKRERWEKGKLDRAGKGSATKKAGDDDQVDANPALPSEHDGSGGGGDECPNLALLQSLMTPCADRGRADTSPECPGPEDLIGFVTSGGFDLARGRGTGVGGIWVQRVLEGWEPEESGTNGEEKTEQTTTGKKTEQMRKFCVVRNAGEKVGRLAVWEVYPGH